MSAYSIVALQKNTRRAMASISPVIRHTVETRSSSGGWLPTLFWPIFSAIHNFHRWTYWKTKLERLPENYGIDYVPGGVVHYLWGSNETVRLLARVNEVALHTLHAIEDLNRLQQNFQELGKLMTDPEEIYIETRWEEYNDLPFISLSTQIEMQEFACRAVHKMRRFTNCFLDIITNSYLLSRDLMYAEFAWEGHALQVIEAGAHFYDLTKEDVKKDLLKGLGIQITDKPDSPKPVSQPISRKSLRERTVAAGNAIKYALSMDWVIEWGYYKGDRYETTPIGQNQQGVQIIIQKREKTLQ
jgi:hypothetical protein